MLLELFIIIIIVIYYKYRLTNKRKNGIKHKHILKNL